MSSTSSAFENFQKCACQVLRQCSSCFHCFRRKRIHPDSACFQNNNKIIKFHSNKLIRVIHYKNAVDKRCNLLDTSQNVSDQSDGHNRTFSFSESDYAFTSWSKPLRLCDECRRSYKNLWQENTCNSSASKPCTDNLKNDNHFQSSDPARLSQKSLDKSLYSIEKFVDAFVKDIISEAVHSVCAMKEVQCSVAQHSEKSIYVSCNVSDDEREIKNLEHYKTETGIKDVEKEHAIKTFSNVLESESKKDRKSVQECMLSTLKINGTPPDCRSYDNANKEPNYSCEEKYAYYNSSYSDTDEEVNVQNKLGEKNVFTHNQKFSVCSHLKNSSAKPVLMFLHGVGCSADIWTHLLLHFGEDGYEVIAPDMLGHGYSSTPDCSSAYKFHNLLKDTLDVFDKFVGETKCIVIGHAFGCSLAAALARYRPQQVSQLVLISGGGPTPLAPRRADFRPPAISPWLQMCLKPFLLCGLKREVLYVPCGKHIETAYSINSGVPSYVLHHIARGQDWPEGDSAFHRRILVPTLLVHGMKDPHVTLVQECEMERTVPRSSLEIIANAGHFAMIETPEKLCHMVHCFINWWNL